MTQHFLDEVLVCFIALSMLAIPVDHGSRPTESECVDVTPSCVKSLEVKFSRRRNAGMMSARLFKVKTFV